MYEIDFLPVEADTGPGGKSGDAIAFRFTGADGTQRVVVIDGGYTAIGEDLVEHIGAYYGTNTVDLAISTHPDADHVNGLKTVVEKMNVGELLIHRPRLHAADVSDFSNIECVDALIATAQAHGTVVNEPFQGLTRFDNSVVVLGPTISLYEAKLAEHLAAQASPTARAIAMLHKAASGMTAAGTDLLSRALSWWPEETLGEDGETSPRNETSVVTLLQCDGRRALFTGDAGLEALAEVADFYERALGPFWQYPLHMLQVPHHGSRRNLSPSLLDRMIGTPGSPHGLTSAVVSSAKADKKHPSPKVVNALGRRGTEVVATEGRTVCEPWGAAMRPGWGPISPIGPLVEDDDD